MDKKDLTEQEIRTRYITPALRQAGWPLDQIREECYLTAGQILPRGRIALRGKRKFADYVLYLHNLPLTIMEAKGNNHSIGLGRLLPRLPEAFSRVEQAVEAVGCVQGFQLELGYLMGHNISLEDWQNVELPATTQDDPIVLLIPHESELVLGGDVLVTS